MEHANEYCIPDLSTAVTTSGSGESFIYNCSNCNNQRRFAKPDEPFQVFCNGLDMGTIDPNAPTYIESEIVE